MGDITYFLYKSLQLKLAYKNVNIGVSSSGLRGRYNLTALFHSKKNTWEIYNASVIWSLQNPVKDTQGKENETEFDFFKITIQK